MAVERPAFKVIKNGYDRFAVDDAFDQYAARIDQLERKLKLYQEQLAETTIQLENTQSRLREAEVNDAARREAAENIARISIREANEIIGTAERNADLIIREALASANGILEDLAILYREAGNAKDEASSRLEQFIVELRDFELPEMPDLRWLQEAQKKLQ